MLFPVNHLGARGACTLGAALLAASVAAAPAAGEGPRDPLAKRWIPSLAITGGATFQQQESTAESSCLNGGFAFPPDVGACSGWNSGPSPLRPVDAESPEDGLIKGDTLVVSPFVGANLQLLAPEIPIPTRPRVFVQGEILPTFASDRGLAAEGNPTGVAVPVNQSDGTPEPPAGFQQIALLGVGSRTISTIDTLVYGASLGIAFPFELRGRKLWIKPSFAWLSYEIQVEGIVEAGLKDDAPLAALYQSTSIRDCTYVPNTTNPMSASCDGISLAGSGYRRRFNGIGPGLELEMEAARWGPVGASLYIDARAYSVLGNRTISFSDSVTYNQPVGGGPLPIPTAGRVVRPPIPADTYTANWSHSVDPWIFRAGVGIRFSWLGN